MDEAKTPTRDPLAWRVPVLHSYKLSPAAAKEGRRITLHIRQRGLWQTNGNRHCSVVVADACRSGSISEWKTFKGWVPAFTNLEWISITVPVRISDLGSSCDIIFYLLIKSKLGKSWDYY